MVARSCLNLLDLVSGDMLNFPQTPRSLPRVMTDPVIMSSGDGKQSNDDDSGVFSSEYCRKIIIVSNSLPLTYKKKKKKGRQVYKHINGFWKAKREEKKKKRKERKSKET